MNYGRVPAAALTEIIMDYLVAIKGFKWQLLQHQPTSSSSRMVMEDLYFVFVA